MQTFIPGEVEIDGELVRLNRVQFSAPGLGLVVVDKAGLHVHDEETVTESVFDPATGTYEDQEVTRPANRELINALNDHQHVVLNHAPKPRAKKKKGEDGTDEEPEVETDADPDPETAAEKNEGEAS